MLPSKLAFVDTETTGLSVTRDRIIEIGIVRVENGKIVAKYQTLLNPQTFLSSFITTLTGITENELENAPTFRSVKKDIFDLLKNAVFVAHNVRFDYNFLRNEFKREDITFSSKHFCTAALSKNLFPNLSHHNLDSIIQKYHFICKNRHRAFDDAEVLWKFYKKLQKEIPRERLEVAVAQGMKRPTLPLGLSLEFLDTLPEFPGVYIFYGENKTPLYVGKSVNIRNRVLSHFSSDNKGKEMKLSSQITDIQTIVTSGELGALLLEASLIKKLQPLYNRMLRVSRRVVVLRTSTNEYGYQTIFLEELVAIDPNQTENIVGVFKSKRQAKDFLITAAKKYKLCEKLLGLEKTKKECFGYRLNSCKGACLQKEKNYSYNTRFLLAFSQQKIQKWPFSSSIVVEEKDPLSDRQDYFVIDKWCLLSKFSKKEDVDEISEEYDYRFDVDTYKILKRYIQQHYSSIHIHPFTVDKMKQTTLS